MRNYIINITKPYVLLPLVASLLVQIQPVTAIEWENLIIAQNGVNNTCTDMKDSKPCDEKIVPPVSKPSPAPTPTLQFTHSW